MLYVTTRGKNDVYTPARTLNLERGTDGGLFVPFRMPQMERQEIKALPEKKARTIHHALIMIFAHLLFTSGAHLPPFGDYRPADQTAFLHAITPVS